MTASFPGSVKNFGSDRVNGDYIPASDMNDVRAEIVAIETTYLAGGWVNVSDTWTWGSAVSFTVPGNQTAIFTKGARVRWKQGGPFRYGVVAFSGFASQTTVTLVANTDFPVLNQAITEPGYSYLGDPVGWPGWFNYTATYTGFSVDPSNVVSKFLINGKNCTVTHIEQNDGTSNATTFTVTLPVAPTLSVNQYQIVPMVRDNNVTLAPGAIRLNTGSTTADLFKSGIAAWTASLGKRVMFTVIYEW